METWSKLTVTRREVGGGHGGKKRKGLVKKHV